MMDLSQGHLLEAPVESEKLWTPDTEESWSRRDDRAARKWAKKFRKEQERVDRYRYRMGNQQWVGMLNTPSQFANGATFSGTAITDISPAPDFTLPAGLQPGTVFRVTAIGQYVGGGSVTTLTIQIMYGGTGGTSLYTTGAVTVSISTTQTFKIEGLFRVLTYGSSGTIFCHGRQQGVSTTANIGVPVQTATLAQTINTTTANTLILTATAGVAFTSVICYLFAVEQLN
jgi:hypothetical protein